MVNLTQATGWESSAIELAWVASNVANMAGNSYSVLNNTVWPRRIIDATPIGRLEAHTSAASKWAVSHSGEEFAQSGALRRGGFIPNLAPTALMCKPRYGIELGRPEGTANKGQ